MGLKVQLLLLLDTAVDVTTYWPKLLTQADPAGNHDLENLHLPPYSFHINQPRVCGAHILQV